MIVKVGMKTLENLRWPGEEMPEGTPEIKKRKLNID